MFHRQSILKNLFKRYADLTITQYKFKENQLKLKSTRVTVFLKINLWMWGNWQCLLYRKPLNCSLEAFFAQYTQCTLFIWVPQLFLALKCRNCVAYIFRIQLILHSKIDISCFYKVKAMYDNCAPRTRFYFLFTSYWPNLLQLEFMYAPVSLINRPKQKFVHYSI